MGTKLKNYKKESYTEEENKMTKQKLLDYLGFAIELERNVEIQNKVINNFDRWCATNEPKLVRKEHIERPECPEDYGGEVISAVLWGLFAIFL